MPREIMITSTLGQSLSIGTQNFANREVLSETTINSSVLGIKYQDPSWTATGPKGTLVVEEDFEGFTQLVESVQESHATAALNRLAERFEDAGVIDQDYLHFNSGAGGRSVLELMTRQSDIYSDVSVGLTETSENGIFAVENADGKFDYYRSLGGIETLLMTGAARPVFYDNFETQLTLSAEHALSQGYSISLNVPIFWIQGQADAPLGRNAEYNYRDALNALFDQIQQSVKTILGADFQAVFSASQHRGYGGKEVALQTLEVIEERADTHFAAPEYQFEASEPALAGTDYVHLNAEGYYLLGQQIAERLFDTLEGNEDLPIVLSGYEMTGARSMIVEFAGVENGLINDPSIFRSDNGFVPPDNMGFGLYNAGGFSAQNEPNIVNVEIVGFSRIRLDFDSDLSGVYQLYIGRNGQNLVPGSPSGGAASGLGFGGTTLRDNEFDIAALPPVARTFDSRFIFEYAPISRIEIDTSAGSTLPKVPNDAPVIPLELPHDIELTGTPPPVTNGVRFLVNSIEHEVTGFKTGQQNMGTVVQGATIEKITLQENSWHQIHGEFIVLENSVLEISFSAAGLAEIQGVGFALNGNLSQSNFFHLGGSQKYGIQEYRYDHKDGSSEITTLELHIGQFFEGTFDALVFANDDDALLGGQSSYSSALLEERNTVPVMTELLFDDALLTLRSFAPGKQDFGNYLVSNNNLSVEISGNAWKKVEGDFEITPDTVISFEMDLLSEGEIQGFGFETDDSPTSSTFVQLAGTQTFGLQNFNGLQSNGSGPQHIEIPIGQLFTGTFDRFVFVNDDDIQTAGAFKMTNISLSMTETPEPTVLSFDGNSYEVDSFSPIGQDMGEATTVGDGDGIVLTGNAWKFISGDFNIDENTSLRFKVSSTGTSEIVGIGFETDDNPTSSFFFQLEGTQTFGRQNYNRDVPEDDGVAEYITIEVGKFISGSFDRLVFVNDDDANFGGSVTFTDLDWV
jgi:hypothetical protein